MGEGGAQFSSPVARPASRTTAPSFSEMRGLTPAWEVAATTWSVTSVSMWGSGENV